MAIHAKNAVIFIKQYKLAGDSNRMAFTYAVDTVEVTGFEAKAKEYVEGKYAWSASMEGYWNAGTNRIDPVIHNLIGRGTHVIGIFPEGTAPNKVGYDGAGYLTSFNPEATIGGAVVFSADVQGEADLYRSTILDAGDKTVGTVTSTARNLGTAGLNRGITSILRALSGNGTCNIAIQASTAEAGTYGNIFSFAQITGAAIELKNVATAAVGPWFRSQCVIPSGGDTFNLTISCATEE